MGERSPSKLKFAAGFAAAAVALWCVIAVLLVLVHRSAIDTATAAGANLARSLAEYENSSIQAIDLSLKVMRGEWLRNPRGFAAAVKLHEDHLSREKVIQVAVVDREGWPVFSKIAGAPRQNFADRDYFRLQAASGGDDLVISAPVMGRITRQWAIQFSRPVRDAGGRFAGIIVVAVPPPALEEIYRQIDLGGEGVVTLARADGVILARTGGLDRSADVSLAGGPSFVPGAPASGTFRRTSRVDGADRFYAYRRLDDYPVTVIVAQGAGSVLAPFYRARLSLVASGALATALLALVALLLFHRARDRFRAAESREQLMFDLHDGCIQSIYAIGLQLQGTRRLIGKDPARAERAVADAGANLNLVIQDLRAFIAGRLQPRSVEEFMAQIERMTPLPSGEGEGPSLAVDIDRGLVSSLNAAQSEHVLGIMREAVSNTLRHAHAGRATLRFVRQDGEARLEVSDDGKGLADATPAGLGLGLNHIRARARKLGGRAQVAGAPGGGTRVEVRFPVAQQP